MPVLTEMSASEQAAAVRAGELSATELVDTALDAIERLNGEINAVVTVVADLAAAVEQILHSDSTG